MLTNNTYFTHPPIACLVLNIASITRIYIENLHYQVKYYRMYLLYMYKEFVIGCIAWVKNNTFTEE